MEQLKRKIFNLLNPDFFWRLTQIYLKEGTVFIIFLLAVRLLSPTDFGLYTYLTSFTYFFILIGDFGVSATTSKLVTEQFHEKRIAMGAVFFNSFVAILASTVISLVAIMLIAPLFLGPYAHLLYYALPTVVLAPLASFYDGFYRGLRQFRKLSILSIISFLIFISTSIYLILMYGLMGALLSQNIFFASFVVLAILLRKEIVYRVDKVIIKEVLKYSLLVGIGSIGYFLYTKIDVIVLGKFGYLIGVAYYDLTAKLFSVLVITFSIFGQIIGPELIGLKHEKEKQLETILRYRKMTIRFAIAISALAIIIIPTAIYFLLPKYWNHTFLIGFTILAITLPFDLWGVVQRQGILVPLGSAKIVTMTVLVGGIINVVSDIFFVVVAGYWGVFLSTFLIHSLTVIYQDRYMRRHILTS